jgi:hypothetical protein
MGRVDPESVKLFGLTWRAFEKVRETALHILRISVIALR